MAMCKMFGTGEKIIAPLQFSFSTKKEIWKPKTKIKPAFKSLMVLISQHS